MSSEAATVPRKTKRPSESKPAPEGDHRKRQRNRTTQSCINCHTSKRMCDRKRPACARCVQLGLSGLCVYEIDDPNQQTGTQDESSRLLKRVAELEGVVRELKNRPLPRWVQTADDVEKWRALSGDKPGSSNAPSPPDTSSSSEKGDSWSSFGANTSLDGSSPGVTTPTDDYTFSPTVARSHGSSSEYDFSMLMNYPAITVNDTTILHHSNCGNPYGHCGCVQDPTNYKNMLELSVRLRKASDVLNRSPTHHLGGFCPLQQRISELDTFTTNVLISASERSPLSESSVCPSFDIYQAMQPFSHPTSPGSGRSISNGRWDISTAEPSSSTALGDPLMTWEPSRSAKFNH